MWNSMYSDESLWIYAKYLITLIMSGTYHLGDYAIV